MLVRAARPPARRRQCSREQRNVSKPSAMPTSMTRDHMQADCAHRDGYDVIRLDAVLQQLLPCAANECAYDLGIPLRVHDTDAAAGTL